MLKKFKMEDCKHVSTAIIIGCKIIKENDSKEVDQSIYRSMIGSLLYVRLPIVRFQDSNLQDSRPLPRKLTL